MQLTKCRKSFKTHMASSNYRVNTMCHIRFVDKECGKMTPQCICLTWIPIVILYQPSSIVVFNPLYTNGFFPSGLIQ